MVCARVVTCSAPMTYSALDSAGDLGLYMVGRPASEDTGRLCYPSKPDGQPCEAIEARKSQPAAYQIRAMARGATSRAFGQRRKRQMLGS